MAALGKVGSPEIERIKRRVARYHILPKRDQVAPLGSEAGKTLEIIYRFYETKRHRFEALATLACESMVRGTGVEYHRGWLTRGTGDGGLDFVGCIDIGDGLWGAKLVVLGQVRKDRCSNRRYTHRSYCGAATSRMGGSVRHYLIFFGGCAT